jgi:predicted lipid-binding transport protein (Tim44 family)
VFDIYTTLIVLALGVLTFLGLRRVFGVRMGRGRPPQRTGKQPVDTSEPLDRYDGVAMPGSPLAKALDAIMAADKNFDVSHFLAGARSAYELIVMAYADGDRQVLTNLLTPGVYEGFEAVIREREARGARVETRFLSIDATSITAAELRGKVAHITMRFVSQLVSATRDRKGNVIDGSADNVTGVTDVWTFARNVTSRDPNWKLAATKNGA